MGQQFQSFQQFQSSWRGGRGERLWLSALVDTMEKASQASRRAEPCDGEALAALRLMEACLAGPDLVDHQLNLGPAKLEIV